MMTTMATMNGLISTLAARMRERRRSLGLTQEQLAEKSDLSANYIAKLEIEDRVPSLQALLSLASALDMEVYELLFSPPGRPWAGAAQEVERVMGSLDKQDAEFILSEFQNIAGYIRGLRKASS
jgi:transcriptional regulator with XRE-family HTH domain